MDWSSQRVLITGGMGFIGSTLAHHLVDRGAAVTVFDAQLPEYGSNPANLEGIKGEIGVVEGDVRDPDAVADAVADANVVYHCAAQLSRTVSNEDPLLDVDINCGGVITVLEAAREQPSPPRVVFTSSQAVVGKPPELPIDEDTPADPLDVYGANKHAGEHYCRIYRRVHDVPTVVARLGNVYGPRAQLTNPNYGVIHRFIGRALRGENLPVFEPGTMQRDFVYVDDVVRALLAVAGETPSDRYVVGTGEGTSILDLAETVVEVAGQGRAETVPWPDDWDSIRVGDLVLDPSRARAELDWSPAVGLEEGLERTIDYYRDRTDQYLE